MTFFVAVCFWKTAENAWQELAKITAVIFNRKNETLRPQFTEYIIVNALHRQTKQKKHEFLAACVPWISYSQTYLHLGLSHRSTYLSCRLHRSFLYARFCVFWSRNNREAASKWCRNAAASNNDRGLMVKNVLFNCYSRLKNLHPPLH